jgi:VanZ family protein
MEEDQPKGAERRRAVLAWVPVLLWMVTILGLSSIPQHDMPSLPFRNADKLIHAAAYATGGLLTVRAAASPAAALAIPCAFGLFDEWRQLSVPGRHCDVADWLADCVGALLGAALWRVMRRRFR